MARTPWNLRNNLWKIDPSNSLAIICEGYPIAITQNESFARRIVYLHNVELKEQVNKGLEAWDSDWK